MRRKLVTALRTTFVLGALIVLTGLHAKHGPGGPDGPDSPNSPDGPDGPDGKKHHGGQTPSPGSVGSKIKSDSEQARQQRPKGSETTDSKPESKDTDDTSNDPAKTEPDFENPVLDDRKLSGYALNPEHPVGKNKAYVIKKKTGLGQEDAQEVKQQILEQVKDGDLIPGKTDQHGSRYGVDVQLTGPKGAITVRTAWIVDAKTGETRLVTVSFP